jgi:voltage-gated potassium channel
MMAPPSGTHAAMRRRFLAGCWAELRVTWPILSGLALAQLALGLLAGLLENWSVGDSLYFSAVTGLTIGYGDIVPLRFVTRVLAIGIGFIGILTTGLVAAIGVRALQRATGEAGRAASRLGDSPRDRAT